MRIVRLRIVAQQAEPDEFSHQVALIKSSGAQFDGRTKTWSRILTPESLTPDILNPLFQAAMDYHTYIEAVQEDQQGGDPETPGTDMASDYQDSS
jgi:hypothetical protein